MKEKLKYNMTQLNPDSTFERHVFHRDQFAHYLRWTYVLNVAEIGMKILDVGCGSGNMYELFYRNRFAPKRYVGVDVRQRTINLNQTKFPKAEFQCLDVVNDELPQDTWGIITCFEMLEHVGKKNVPHVLDNICDAANKDTIILISTPNYDESVGPAENHIIDGEIGEMTVTELERFIVNSGLEVMKMYGTFASKRDIIPLIQKDQALLRLYNKFHEYYDANLMSVIFAPLFPHQSRNVLWVLRKRQRSHANRKTVDDLMAELKRSVS
jgi:2-polyprenyl-3-methyl-5-hydroxy-6-metoxy-1,4-benzoquinol methylase